MEELNHSLFLLINASAHPAPGMLFMATAVAQWLMYGVPLLLTGLWLWGGRESRTAAVTAVLTILLGLGCNVLIGIVWPHPRPFMIELGNTFLAHAPDTSFPSDHAVVFFSLGMALLWSHLRKTGALLIVLGAAVGWARVYLGVHFPFDIAGGFLVALLCSWVVARPLSFKQLKMRLVDGLESVYRGLLALPISKGWIYR